MPEAQIWGGGRIVWVETGPGGQRRVLEGTLTAGELRAALDRVVGAGFFGWDHHYAGQPTPQPAALWPRDPLGFSLAGAVAGRWFEAEALGFTWRTVNANPWNARVLDGDTYYQISVIVPGLSHMPVPPP